MAPQDTALGGAAARASARGSESMIVVLIALSPRSEPPIDGGKHP
jgi:hypothetical protein